MEDLAQREHDARKRVRGIFEWRLLSCRNPHRTRLSCIRLEPGTNGGGDSGLLSVDRLAGKVYGAITFIVEHPAGIEAYLADQERAVEEIKAQFPMPPEMMERFAGA